MTTTVASACKNARQRAKKAVVWLSKSRCIYKNLALEDWLFRNYCFEDVDGLLAWTNDRAVVVGRHQNVFTECKVDFAQKVGIQVARRQSGGGTVFHTHQCYLFSMLSSNQRYDRTKNLNMVCDAFNEKWNINATVSPRHDILVNRHKISGSASKLSSKAAYHHFTMLIACDPRKMNLLLESSFKQLETSKDFAIESRATPSVRSHVGWLFQSVRHISNSSVETTVVDKFKSLYGDEHTKIRTLKLTDFTEANFPGLQQIQHELRSWEWIYGVNPPFTLVKKSPDGATDLIRFTVEKGLVAKVESEDATIRSYCEQFLGRRFEPNIWFDVYHQSTKLIATVSLKI